MKILALTRYDRNGPSSRLRTFLYIPHLKFLGIDVQIEPLFNAEYVRKLYSYSKRSFYPVLRGYIKRMKKLLNSSQYDLVWIEKELFPWIPKIDNWMLSKINLPYVVDYDDAIFHRYDQHQSSIIRAILGKKLDGLMRRATTVIVGNSYLADRAEKAGANQVKIIPTVVDTQRYTMHQMKNKKFTIGWIGTPITEKYLEIIEKPINALAHEIEFKIALVGASHNALDGLTPKLLKWSEETEVSSIQSFDVGIMPLSSSPFERGKCGYKIIQCMACGVPVVASPVGVNCEIVDHGENGFLANNEGDWIKYLKILHNDSQLRQSMGQNARAKIEKNYSLSGTVPKLAKILRDASLNC